MRLDSDDLKRQAADQGRTDIVLWIEDREAAASVAKKLAAEAPIKTPAGVLEYGKRYNVTVRKLGAINPPAERRLRNVTIGSQQYGGRGLVYPSGQTAVGFYDIKRITKIEESK